MTTLYCSWVDIQNRMSVAGSANHIDDDPSTYADIIDEASIIIEEYLLPHYTASAMSTNRWVKYACATIACVLMMQRRGNDPPRSLRKKYEELLEKLEAVMDGRKQVPGLTRKRTSIPVLSKTRVILSPTGPLVVVSKRRGSPQASPPIDYRQPRDATEPPRPPGVA